MLVTTAAMTLDVIPLIVASGAGVVSRFNMGMVIASGLSISTLFTLLVVLAVHLCWPPIIRAERWSQKIKL